MLHHTPAPIHPCQEQITKGKELAAENGYTFCQTSAKSGHNVSKAIKHICREIINNRAKSNLDGSGSRKNTVSMQRPKKQLRR